MNLDEVKKAVLNAASQGVLTCADARALAEELGVEYLTVGKACDEVGVKIRACSLGCF